MKQRQRLKQAAAARQAWQQQTISPWKLLHRVKSAPLANGVIGSYQGISVFCTHHGK